MVSIPRRSVLSKITQATMLTGISSNIAHASPSVHTGAKKVFWRMTSSFPKSLDTLYGTAEYMAQEVFKMSDWKF